MHEAMSPVPADAKDSVSDGPRANWSVYDGDGRRRQDGGARGQTAAISQYPVYSRQTSGWTVSKQRS